MTTLISDPCVAEIPVYDNAEPLVDLATQGIACYGRTAEARSGRLTRSGLADRLVTADALLPAGVRLLVREGFRSTHAQQAIWNRYSRRLRTNHPGIGDHEVRRLTSRYVAPLDVAPHVAGAAVDLTLIDCRGSRLDMGTLVDATPEESSNACAFDAPMISLDARANRELLATALTTAGLVNYPTEWWHWSYGDRYWAYATGASHACYGPVSPDRVITAAIGASS
jgi:zinc D-Ala-D-Ala dipeptidase